MDTNGHEWVGENHETHEIHEMGNQNHEWTRMDTNGWEGTTLATLKSICLFLGDRLKGSSPE